MLGPGVNPEALRRIQLSIQAAFGAVFGGGEDVDFRRVGWFFARFVGLGRGRWFGRFLFRCG